MELTQALVVFLVTCFFSFGVQTLTFYLYKWKNHPLIAEHKSVLQYMSGVIGDLILVPLINVFCVMTLIYLNKDFNQVDIWRLAIPGGVIITFLFHYAQQVYKSTNWTMPEVGRWNLLGVYHALFMFTECTFLSYTLINVINSGVENGFGYILTSPVNYAFLVLGVFFLTFLYDYRHYLRIPNKPGRKP